MAFTDQCDLFAAIHEDGVNLIAKHVMRQRPSLVNYATAYVAGHPELACSPVAFTVDVANHFNPLFGVVAPLPILGADAPPVGLNFCVQLVQAEVDFYPGNVIKLPASLNPPLKPQHVAAKLRICGGMDCPPEDILKSISPAPPPRQTGERQQPPPPPFVPPTRKLLCFCVDAYLVAHVHVENIFGKLMLVGSVDGVEVVGILPDGLRANIDCYARTTFEVLLREKLMLPVSKLLFDISLLNVANVSGTLTPNPPIPNNPAIEDDQLKVFIDLTITP